MPNHIRPFAGQIPNIDPTAWIDPTALVIGDVTLGAGSSLWPMAVVRGDIHRIQIGQATNLQDACVLHVTHASRFVPGGHPVLIGDRVTVGHQAVLHGCVIGDQCLIGIGARVLDGVRVEPCSMVAAGALVPPGQHLESGYLWVGAPARKARPLTEREIEYLDYVAHQYVKLAQRYQEELCG